ncbi:MAG: Vitamin K-dependent gamma-carboxylase, partial [Bacteroidota bacterium]
ILSSILVIIGWRTSTFMFINAITIFYVMATPNFFGKLWHEQIIIWISWIMALSNASNVWSFDAILKGKITKLSGNNTWPIRLIWLHFGLIYFWAGFYKIWDAGFDWALSDSMINQVQLEWLQHYDKIPEVRIDLYPFLLHFGGLSVIIFELLFPFFILIKSWRWLAFFGGLLMHNLLGYFMYISFLHFLQVFYIYFVDFNWMIKNKGAEIDSKFTINKKVKLGILILVLNLFAGMFNVNSYPFSAYPKYSALIPNKIQFIRFNAKNNGVDTFFEAKKSGFRWEDYGWLEYEIINKYKEGKFINNDLKDYWSIWKSKINNLKNCENIAVELCERHIKPEGMKHIIIVDTLVILKN